LGYYYVSLLGYVLGFIQKRIDTIRVHPLFAILFLFLPHLVAKNSRGNLHDDFRTNSILRTHGRTEICGCPG
jgi:hypothetical protein